VSRITAMIFGLVIINFLRNFGVRIMVVGCAWLYGIAGTHLFGMNTILWYMYVLVCIYKVSDEWICMSDVIHGLWIMNLDKSWHAISMKWLVSKWHGIGMKYNSIFMDWEGWVGMDSTWKMNVDLVIKVGMRVICMINWLSMIGLCQCVIPWASRWDLMVVLQWSRRNSMTPISGSSRWCSIYIIW